MESIEKQKKRQNGEYPKDLAVFFVSGHLPYSKDFIVFFSVSIHLPYSKDFAVFPVS